MALETIATEGWIYQTLAADVELQGVVGGRIYNSHAPQGIPHPFVIYTFMAGTDIYGNGMYRIMVSLLYLVKVICEGRPNDADRLDAVRLAANRVDEVLAHAVNQVAFGYVFHSWRESEVHYLETDTLTNRSYLHLGGLFRIEAHPH